MEGNEVMFGLEGVMKEDRDGQNEKFIKRPPTRITPRRSSKWTRRISSKRVASEG